MKKRIALIAGGIALTVAGAVPVGGAAFGSTSSCLHFQDSVATARFALTNPPASNKHTSSKAETNLDTAQTTYNIATGGCP